jgi:uncharacterized protein
MTDTAKQPFHIMTKPVGPLCNLDCHYCFYLEKEKLYPDAHGFRMNDAVLEKYIREYIAAQPVSHVSFAWQGGEPTLMGVDYFRRVVELQQKYANGKIIDNSFQTNGVLLNDEWAGFLAANKFLVGLSIDGPEKIHDTYRRRKGGKGSFRQVINGLSYLKKHGVEFNTLTVVNRKNARYPLEVYRFLKEIGSTYMQFIPVVERATKTTDDSNLKLIAPGFNGDSQVTDWSVIPEDFGRFLSTIFDEWVRADVGRYFVQIFDVALEAWYGLPPSLCIFREECGSALAMEHNGDLYSCDHFVYPENKLGNIMSHRMADMIESPQQVRFGKEKYVSLPRYCRDCRVSFICNGECPKHRFLTTPDGEGGLNYLCAGYLHFFTHIDPYMRYMAGQLRNRQAPANVMNWVREKDNASPN